MARHTSKGTAAGKEPEASSPKTTVPPIPQSDNVLPIIPANFEPIRLEGHRDLIVQQSALFRRFNDHPELATLLLINPVLAFGEVGVEMSREIAHHVLHTLQHPPRQRRRRDELEASLKEKIGELPRPEDPQWVSQFLFEKLQLTPLKTDGLKPAYKAPLNAAAIERLQALRPKRQLRRQQQAESEYKQLESASDQPATRLSTRVGRSALRIKMTHNAPRRLDIEADLPPLQEAHRAPTEVNLETLYFYKDSHPLACDLLELGIIKRRSFPIHSGDSYRQIKEGQKNNAFRTWVKSIRFAEAPDDESNG
jgi:hypothetical protein